LGGPHGKNNIDQQPTNKLLGGKGKGGGGKQENLSRPGKGVRKT